jgi:hypothetical protein
MSQDKVQLITFRSSAEIVAMSDRLEKILRALTDARQRLTVTADEALIFLALGQLGLAPSSVGFMIKPVTCSDISDLLKMPKESVRRKAAHLVEIDLAAHTTRGILIKNVDEWCGLAEAVTR